MPILVDSTVDPNVGGDIPGRVLDGNLLATLSGQHVTSRPGP